MRFYNEIGRRIKTTVGKLILGGIIVIIVFVVLALFLKVIVMGINKYYDSSFGLFLLNVLIIFAIISPFVIEKSINSYMKKCNESKSESNVDSSHETSEHLNIESGEDIESENNSRKIVVDGKEYYLVPTDSEVK